MTATTRLCLQPWNTINVGADGKVYPCCVCSDELVIGHLAETPLEEIIAGPWMIAIRRQLLTGDLQGSCVSCHNAEPSTVEAMEETLSDYLPGAAAEVGAVDRLVPLKGGGHQIYLVGSLRTSSVTLAGREELEVYSGFSSAAYLEGRPSVPDSFTIGCWIKRNASSANEMLFHYAHFKDNAWQGSVIELAVGVDGAPRAVLSPNGYAENAVLVSPPVPERRWTHIAVTKDVAGTTLFVNGALVAQGPALPTSLANPEAIARIGVNCSPARENGFGGAIAGFFVEPAALSPADVREIYAVERHAFKALA